MYHPFLFDYIHCTCMCMYNVISISWSSQPLGSSAAHCNVSMSPLSGNIGPRETISLTLTVTWNSLVWTITTNTCSTHWTMSSTMLWSPHDYLTLCYVVTLILMFRALILKQYCAVMLREWESHFYCSCRLMCMDWLSAIQWKREGNAGNIHEWKLRV